MTWRVEKRGMVEMRREVGLTCTSTVLVVETTLQLFGACAGARLDAVVEAPDISWDAETSDALGCNDDSKEDGRFHGEGYTAKLTRV